MGPSITADIQHTILLFERAKGIDRCDIDLEIYYYSMFLLNLVFLSFMSIHKWFFADFEPSISFWATRCLAPKLYINLKGQADRIYTLPRKMNVINWEVNTFV